MLSLHTTLGPKTKDDLGLILPHEHVFVDLGPTDRADFGQAETQNVVALMSPEIAQVKAQGVSALVECTPADVGRRVDIVKAVSIATNFPIAVATGLYREPWTPQWARDATEDELREWMMLELQDGIEDTGVRASFIKLSAGDDGITPVETKLLRAATHAARATNAAIGSHTIRGRVVRNQLDILEAAGGYTASRFIWIHASADDDFTLNLEMARRGAWIEYDWIGGQPDEFIVKRVHRMLDAGFGHRLLLSMDRGWFDPSKSGGGTPQPYTYLVDTFLPKLKQSGVDDATIQTLTHDNPFRAFAR